MKTRTRAMSLLMSIMLVIGIMAGTAPVAYAADVEVVIYHTNDMHGYVQHVVNSESNEVTQLGLDRVAALRNSTENSLLVDAGDFSQGHLFANLSNGVSVIEVMNAAKYDVAAMGNHEFDFSIPNMEENITLAEFEVLSANVSVSDEYAEEYPSIANMPLYTVKEAGGKKIAFFAVNTPELNGMVSPKKLNSAGISVRTDVSEVAKELVALIKAEVPDVDAIIALTHAGYAEGTGGNENSMNVAAVEGVDAVIDGHDHQTRLGESAKNVNGTLVVSTGTGMTNLGKLTLTFSDSGALSITSTNAFDDAKDLEPDASVSAVIDKWAAFLDQQKGEVMMKSAINLWGGNLTGLTAADEEVTASIARRGETNASNLMNDARIWTAKQWLEDNYADPLYAEYNLTTDMPVLTFIGGGFIRGRAMAGDITLDKMLSVFSGSLEDAEDSYIIITPKVLYDTIEHGVNIFFGQDAETGMLDADGGIHGRFPQPGGFSYVYDITQPKSDEYDKDAMTLPANIGTRVQSITLDDGTVLDRNDNETQILFAVAPYNTDGGDGYWMLGLFNDVANYGGYQYVPNLTTSGYNRGDMIINYVNTLYGGTVPADAYPFLGRGRITRVNDVYTGTGFDAKFTVMGEGEATLGSQEFKVYVDGVEQAETSDADGIVTLSLSNGPHEVRFIGADFDSGTVYVDNYVGLHNAVISHNPGEILPGEVVEGGESSESSEPQPETPAEGGSNTMLYVVIGVVIVAIVAFVFLRKKPEEAAAENKAEPKAEPKEEAPVEEAPVEEAPAEEAPAEEVKAEAEEDK